MDILTISNMYPSDSDPVYGTFVKNFIDELKRRNPDGVNDISVIAGKRKGKKAKAIAYIGFYTSTLWKLLTRRYDLVYVHTITFPIIPIRIASVFRRHKFVFNVHGDDVLPSTSLKKRLKEIARPVLPKAAMIVVPSTYFADVVLHEFSGITPDKVFISPSGGLNKRFYLGAKKPIKSSASLRLGFVSRIDTGKGWDTFLLAVKRLVDDGIEVEAVIAGRGAQSDEMLAMIDKLRLGHSVNYLGPVPQNELPAVYASFDVFVFPSTRSAESLGLVGLEAMAAHTPVIASQMAGPAGYVVNGHNGYLFQPGNADDLYHCIKSYLALNDSQRMALSENAYATALDYNAEDVASALYEKLTQL